MNGITVGIDIGGTKTHLRAYDPAGHADDLIVPSAEWRLRDWTGDARALVGFVETLAGGRTVDGVAVGAHGCDNQEECDAFAAGFRAVTAIPVKIVNDAELIPASIGEINGIGVVAGTGSIAVTRNTDGRMLVAGGWGWVIGDEGSAAGLVREAGRAISKYLDCGGSPDEPLVRALFRALDIDNPARIGSQIAGAGGAAALGRHASAIFDAASMGSTIAQTVIDEGASALVDLVERLRMLGAEASSVVAGGGVIVAQPGLANAFLQAMDARFGSSLSVSIYPGPPVEGACNIAKAFAASVPLSGLPERAGRSA
jgi:N-acetylglucosamine kinase-like BadF-type ATPase